MNEAIGVGVIGAGLMGRRHAENAARHVPEAHLAAVFDANAEVARHVAGELDARVCASVEELLAREEVDVVVIASPSRFHAEQAVAACRAGKDVLVEKPMAHSLADCDRVIEAAERAKARLQVGFMRRYDPAYAEAHRLIGSKVLGDPLLFRAVHRDREAEHLPASDGVTNVMFESAIHDFDLSRFLLGDEIARVSTIAAVLCHERGSHGHAPNAALNAVTFARGAVADIETYRGALYAYDVRTEVVCSSGTVVIGQHIRTGLEVLTREGARHDLVPAFLERFADAYRLELADFVRGARERRPAAVTGRDGRAAVAAALAGVASYASGRPETVAA